MGEGSPSLSYGGIYTLHLPFSKEENHGNIPSGFAEPGR